MPEENLLTEARKEGGTDGLRKLSFLRFGCLLVMAMLRGQAQWTESAAGVDV